jgi:Transposase DDE domain
MKNKLLSLIDKLLLRKRSVIESTNQLKNVFHLEHSRHRSAFNGFANILAAVIAYIFHPNKPRLKLSEQDRTALMAA